MRTTMPGPESCNARRGYPASANDWHEQRENIQRLYCTKDKSLSLVVIEMKRLYGFEATYVLRAFILIGLRTHMSVGNASISKGLQNGTWIRM